MLATPSLHAARLPQFNYYRRMMVERSTFNIIFQREVEEMETNTIRGDQKQSSQRIRARLRVGAKTTFYNEKQKLENKLDANLIQKNFGESAIQTATTEPSSENRAQRGREGKRTQTKASVQRTYFAATMVHIFKPQHCRRGMGYGRKKRRKGKWKCKSTMCAGISPRLNEEGDQTEAKISERAPVCVDVCPRSLQERDGEQVWRHEMGTFSLTLFFFKGKTSKRSRGYVNSIWKYV